MLPFKVGDYVGFSNCDVVILVLDISDSEVRYIYVAGSQDKELGCWNYVRHPCNGLEFVLSPLQVELL
jgi:hypothetical protein